METYTISELAKQFNISTRTIRYYEEIGLLEPERNESGRRIFSKRERIRLESGMSFASYTGRHLKKTTWG